MFVCPAKAVLLAGAATGPAGSAAANQAYSFAPASPHVAASPMHPSQFGSGGAIGTPKSGTGQRTPGGSQSPSVGRPAMAASRGRRDNAFIGKTVKITMGPYKVNFAVDKS